MRTIVSILLLGSLWAQAQEVKPSYYNISNKEFARLLLSPNIVVLDVRTPEEYAEGHIAGATLLNFYDDNFDKNLQALDKNKTYLVYCQRGGRSSKTAQRMADLGFTRVYNLQHGFSEWDGPVQR